MKRLISTVIAVLAFGSLAARAAGELPAGYTAVEYLVAPKGAYIDTGYTANGQTKVVFDAVVPPRWEQNDRFGVLFGSRTMTDWTTKAFALQMCTGNSETLDTVRFVYNGEYRQDGSKPFSFGERVTVTCDGQHIEWTGSKAASVEFTADPLTSSKSTLYIFADNSVSNDGAKSKDGVNPGAMRLYSFKIYEGETLKRDFVPVLNEKGERGLMDLANGNKFYPLKSDYAGLSIARVPAVAVPKGAFIDTGIKPDSETRVTMDVLIDRGESLSGVFEGEYWFGCWDEDYNKGAFAFGNDGTGVYAGYGNQGGTVGSIVADGRHTVELDGNKVKVDGADYHSFTNESFALKQNLYLFAQNRAGKVLGVSDYQSRIICMGCKIYHGGKLVRDFVPARMALIGGPYGLYDRVEGVFYRNANPVPIIEISNSAKLMYRRWDKDSNGLVFSVSPQKCTFIDKDATELKNDCWYAAVGDATLGHGLTIDNSVHLILADGCYLEANGGYRAAGIEVEWGTTNDKLHIYGQEGDTGRLVAKGGFGAAGIGGRANSSYGSHCGNIYIHGGKIKASSVLGAGIGGGALYLEDKGCDGPAELVIYGGEIFAESVNGAGIGGGGSTGDKGKGGSCGSISVFGGVVEASGAEVGIGPGPGEKGQGKTMNLKISGGRVFAHVPWNAAIKLPSSKDLKIEGRPVSFWNSSNRLVGSYDNGTMVTISREPVGTRWNPLRIGTTGPLGLPNADVWAYLEGDCLVCDGEGSISVSAFLPSIVLSGLDVKKVKRLVIGAGITAIEENAFAIIGIEKPVKLEFLGNWPADDRPTLINVPWRGGYFYTRTYTQKITSAGPLEFTAVVIDGEEQKDLPASAGSMDYVVCAGSRVTVRYRFAGCLFEETRTIGASGPDGEWIPSPITSVSYLDDRGNEQWTDAVVVTELTDKFEDGRWYVVTGEVSRGGIDLQAGGTANLILADGASLAVQGVDNDAGIDVNQGETLNIFCQRGGTGRLTATGGRHGAGIGGGDEGAGGKVTINGGIVTAQGRAGGAGIGGGYKGAGGAVAIADGTVIADGPAGLGGEVTIDGGSIKATIQCQPHNGKGQDVYRVTVEVEELKAERMKVEGLDGYGTKDIVPIDGKVYLYLPNGMHSFAFSDESKTLNFYAVVNGRATTVEPMPPLKGFFVNGMDIGSTAGTGWYYDLNRCLHFTGGGTYVLSGLATNDEVQVSVDASDAKLVFSNAVVFTSGRAALEVEKSTSLLMAGDASYLAATNGASAVTVAADAALTVDLGPGGNRFESMICTFGFDAANAIVGDGAVQVKGGTFVALADASAVGVKTFTCDADSVIMAVGDDPENARFASSAGASKYVLVAPFCRVLVPVEIPGIRSYVVADTTEPIAPSGTVNATNVFKVMVLDDITIDFTADEGYEIVGGGRVTIPRITGDVTFGSADLPAPDVRRLLTVTLPESLEGVTCVVREDGEEVKVKGEGEMVYPVRSGYDVEIVCTAQEGWRLVSESNVVTFANIQESKVLTAADLPQARRVFTVRVPAVANVAHALTSTDGQTVDAGSGVYMIISNAEVTVLFFTDGDYRITANGEKTWTLTGDVAFGVTDGFPLPTVEGIPGTVAAPWPVGEDVQAYTNSLGVLAITGTGAMSNFTNAADVPWDPDAVTCVAVADGVVRLGANSFAALDDAVTVNGTTMALSRFIAPALGPEIPEQPAGAVSPAEFERIDIVDGKAYLGVSVYTSDTITNQNWSVATNGVIEVPAEGKQGFFYLISKPAVPSNKPIVPPPLPIEQ